MLPSVLGLPTALRTLLPVISCLLIGGIAHASTQCDGIEDIRALRRALADDSCTQISLAGELPAISVPLSVTRDVFVHAGPWSIPPLQIGSADTDPFVVIVEGVLSPTRALEVAAGVDASSGGGTTPRTLPVVLEVVEGATLILAATTVAVPSRTPSDAGRTRIPILQSANTATTVGLFGIETEAPLGTTLVYQEGRTDAHPCTASAAMLHTADLSALADTVRAAGRSAEALAELGDFEQVRPSRIELTPGGGLLGTACWSNSEGYDTLSDAPPARLQRLELSGTTGTHAIESGVASDWSVFDAAGPIEVDQALFAALVVQEAPVFSSKSTVRVAHTLAAGLTLADQPLIEAAGVFMDQGILCNIGGSTGLVRVGTDESALSVFSRLAIDRLDTALVESDDALELVLQHLTVRATTGELLPVDAETTLLNSYFEGAFNPFTRADGAPVTASGLRLAVAACPDDATGCTSLPMSALATDTRDCTDVLVREFRAHDQLAAWSETTPSMPRLRQEPASSMDRSVAPSSALYRDDTILSCLDEGSPSGASSLLVGAWPTPSCGLPPLRPTDAVASDLTGDTAAPDAASTEATAAFGCAGRSAAILLLGLLPLTHRRRSSAAHGTSPDEETAR